MSIRRLKPGDEVRLESFLRENAATSMHIRSNVRREGLYWDGDKGRKPKRHQGIYYGAFDNSGNIVGMAGYFWNGNILMQPGDHVAGLLDAMRQEKLTVKGMLGPAAKVREAISYLGLEDWPMQISRDESVYVVELAELKVPAVLADGIVKARPAVPSDRELLINWRIAFNIEALNANDDEKMRSDASEEMDARIGYGLTILERDGTPVAMSGRDEALPDSVTVGPVWTPPEHRSNGYARSVVAGSLLMAKENGATRSVLFTDNPYAARAYEAVGYQPVDSYGLTILAKPFDLSP